ncbi:MAG: VOC family protein [Pseudomonadota bacterium]
MTNPAPIRALGEVAIRCRDHATMKAFYRDVVGLEIMKDFPDSRITFFRISKGYAGHTTILALFDSKAIQRDVHEQSAVLPEAGARSTLHHLALTVDHERQEALCAYLEGLGLSYSVQEFEWIGWRGVFIRDPEGNTIEFVAYDPGSNKNLDD